MKDRHKGILVALLGVLIISPDAVLVQFLSYSGRTDPWVIIFWKLLFSVTISAPFALYESGGFRALYDSVVYAKYYYLCAIPVQSMVDIGFTLSLTWTTAANAILLLNLNSLWCAVLGRLFLGDELPRRTIIALFLAMGCMMIIFVPDILHRQGTEQEIEEEEEDDEIQPSTKGNVTAFFTGVMLAVYISIVRKGGMKNSNNSNTEDENDNRQVNLVGATSIAAILGSMVALIIRRGKVLPDSDAWRGEGDEDGEGELWKFWLAMGADGMALGIIFVCLSVAPRLAKGAEVALVLHLEIILGPLLVFFAYGTVPSVWTLVGGSVLFVVLVLHESVPLFQKAHREFSKHMSGRFSTKSKTAVEDSVVAVEDNDVIVADEHGGGNDGDGRNVENEANGR